MRLFEKVFFVVDFDLLEENMLYQTKVILDSEEIISFQTEIPRSIKKAMSVFIEDHPNWDQYRLLHAALSGFLVQD